ncbi:MAG: PQQ-binding-like beta-propeller repeat protein [Candidatus Coatesbacteria bacterium]|nr:PQQ-binding-like beta-propeller repeat protein [Candidatus Coatesbacteria bacterium]
MPKHIKISQEELELIRKGALAEVDRLMVKLKDTINSYFLRFRAEDVHTWSCYRGNPGHTGTIGPTAEALKGEPAFTYEVGDGIVTAPTLTPDHILTAAGGGNELHCIDLQSGERSWALKLEHEITTPAAIGWDGYVYIAAADRQVYSIGIESGLIRWSFSVDDRILQTPCLHEESLFLTTQEGYLVAVDTTRGMLKWISPWESAFSEPTIGRGVLYLSTYDGCLMSVYIGSGDIRWKTESYGNAGSSAAFYDNKLYFSIPETAGELEDKLGSNRPYLLVIDAHTGELLWKHETIASLISTPAVFNGRVYTVAQNYLEALSAVDGQKVWRAATKTPIRTSPVVTDDLVYVVTKGDLLHAFDIFQGEETWSHQLPAACVGSPAYSSGRLVLTAEDGKLYAFK